MFRVHVEPENGIPLTANQKYPSQSSKLAAFLLSISSIDHFAIFYEYRDPIASNLNHVHGFALFD